MCRKRWVVFAFIWLVFVQHANSQGPTKSAMLTLDLVILLTCVCVHACVCVCMRVCVHACVCACVYECVQPCVSGTSFTSTVKSRLVNAGALSLMSLMITRTCTLLMAFIWSLAYALKLRSSPPSTWEKDRDHMTLTWLVTVHSPLYLSPHTHYSRTSLLTSLSIRSFTVITPVTLSILKKVAGISLLGRRK